jgi:hypothetical protein
VQADLKLRGADGEAVNATAKFEVAGGAPRQQNTAEWQRLRQELVEARREGRRLESELAARK